MALYHSYELRYGPGTRRALSHLLEEAIRRHGVVVIEQERRIVGAFQLVGATPTVMYCVHTSPLTHEHEQKGLSWALAACALDVTRAARLGAVVTLAMSNPMTIPPSIGQMDLYSLVASRRRTASLVARPAAGSRKLSPARRHRP